MFDAEWALIVKKGSITSSPIFVSSVPNFFFLRVSWGRLMLLAIRERTDFVSFG
jgi:hypothetical protein